MSSADFFKNHLFREIISGTLSGMSKGLDPDQDRHFVGLDLDRNCLQRLSADDKSCSKQGKRLSFAEVWNSIV